MYVLPRLNCFHRPTHCCHVLPASSQGHSLGGELMLRRPLWGLLALPVPSSACAARSLVQHRCVCSTVFAPTLMQKCVVLLRWLARAELILFPGAPLPAGALATLCTYDLAART